MCAIERTMGVTPTPESVTSELTYEVITVKTKPRDRSRGMSSVVTMTATRVWQVRVLPLYHRNAVNTIGECVGDQHLFFCRQRADSPGTPAVIQIGKESF